MLEWLKSRFGVPHPSGPPETIRQFRNTEPTLSAGDLAVEGDGWVVNSKDTQTVRLFEVAGLLLEQRGGAQDRDTGPSAGRNDRSQTP